jgi:hypothetical protein
VAKPEPYGDDPCQEHPGKPHDLGTGLDWLRRIEAGGGDR